MSAKLWLFSDFFVRRFDSRGSDGGCSWRLQFRPPWLWHGFGFGFFPGPCSYSPKLLPTALAEFADHSICNCRHPD